MTKINNGMGRRIKRKCADCGKTFTLFSKNRNFHIRCDICDEIHSMKDMMKSCYAYEGLKKSNPYIFEYKKILGKELFNKTYAEYSKYLRKTFNLEINTYTDSEGLTYNTLVKKVKRKTTI